MLSCQAARVRIWALYSRAYTTRPGVHTNLGCYYETAAPAFYSRSDDFLRPAFYVRGRINISGEEILPMNRLEAKQAVAELLEKDIDYLCINLLFSYRNPKHELAVRDIALEVMKERGVQVPVFLASEMYPVRGDFPRLNTLLIEAYAAEPSREQLQRIRDTIHGTGATCGVRIMASHGGTISIEARELAKTLISGPIGGVVGGKHLA